MFSFLLVKSSESTCPPTASWEHLGGGEKISEVPLDWSLDLLPRSWPCTWSFEHITEVIHMGLESLSGIRESLIGSWWDFWDARFSHDCRSSTLYLSLPGAFEVDHEERHSYANRPRQWSSPHCQDKACSLGCEMTNMLFLGNLPWNREMASSDRQPITS